MLISVTSGSNWIFQNASISVGCMRVLTMEWWLLAWLKKKWWLKIWGPEKEWGASSQQQLGKMLLKISLTYKSHTRTVEQNNLSEATIITGVILKYSQQPNLNLAPFKNKSFASHLVKIFFLSCHCDLCWLWQCCGEILSDFSMLCYNFCCIFKVIGLWQKSGF